MPFGLILLCEECKDLLMGYISFSTVEEFIRMWQDCISSFDHQSNASYQIDESELFQQVTVCGNGFTICRKLEKLIQQYFHENHDVDPDNYTLSQRLNIATIDEELEPQVIDDIVQCAESLQVADEDGELVNEEIPFDCDRQENRYQDEGHLLEDKNGSELHESSDQTETLSEEVDGGKCDETTEPQAVKLNTTSGAVEDGEISIENTSTKSKVVSTTNNLRKSRDSIRNVKSSIPKPLSSNISKATAVANGDRLIDFYPHFGMIFPVAYKQLGSVR